MNTIGTAFRITLFGSSHGTAVGCTVDGCPPGISIRREDLESDLSLRRPEPGIGTARIEEDAIGIISGLVDSVSTGTPITITIANRDVDSSKYIKFKRIPRPGHADFPAIMRYGEAHDIRGGGQFSGRMTAPLVAAGTVAKALLSMLGVKVAAYTQSIGKVVDDDDHDLQLVLEESRQNSIRAASADMAELMRGEILSAAEDGDSVGGAIQCHCEGLPVGVGEPFFDTLEGEISKMLFSIPGVKGVEFGSGFRAAGMRGSEHNDPYAALEGQVITVTNNHGGILGGLSTGMPLRIRVAFKPTASIAKEQRSVDLATMKEASLRIEGRHDPCIVPRAVVVVEAVVSIVLVDLCLRGGFLG
jgi:chorismate synthase